MATSNDFAYKNELIEKIVEICSINKYKNITDFEWYLGVLSDLTAIRDSDCGPLICAQLLDVVIRVKIVRPFAVDCAITMLERHNNPLASEHSLDFLYAAAFIVGEYAEFCKEHIVRVLCAMLVPNEVLALPERILAVYMITVFKLIAFLIVNLNEDDSEPLTLALEVVQNNIAKFTLSSYAEVQERACLMLEFIRIYQKESDSRAGIKSDLAKLLSEILNPVSPNAQAKVPVPPGLELDKWIHEPLPEEKEQFDAPWIDGGEASEGSPRPPGPRWPLRGRGARGRGARGRGGRGRGGAGGAGGAAGAGGPPHPSRAYPPPGYSASGNFGGRMTSISSKPPPPAYPDQRRGLGEVSIAPTQEFPDPTPYNAGAVASSRGGFSGAHGGEASFVIKNPSLPRGRGGRGGRGGPRGGGAGHQIPRFQDVRPVLPLTNNDHIELTYSITPIPNQTSVLLDINLKNKTAKVLKDIKFSLDENPNFTVALGGQFAVIPSLSAFGRQGWKQNIETKCSAETVTGKIEYSFREKAQEEEKPKEDTSSQKSDAPKSEGGEEQATKAEGEPASPPPAATTDAVQEEVEDKPAAQQEKKDVAPKTNVLTFSLNVQASVFTYPKQFDKESFYTVIRAGARHTVITNKPSPSIARATMKLQEYFHLAIIEQERTKASLYGSNARGHHIVFLLKLAQQERGGGIAVSIRSNNPELSLSLLGELEKVSLC